MTRKQVPTSVTELARRMLGDTSAGGGHQIFLRHQIMEGDEKIFFLGSRPVYGLKLVKYIESNEVIHEIIQSDQTQETIALLKILALGSRQIEAGKVEPATVVIQRLRERRTDR